MGPVPILCDRYLQHPLLLIQSQSQTLRVNEHLKHELLWMRQFRIARAARLSCNQELRSSILVKLSLLDVCGGTELAAMLAVKSWQVLN